MAQQAIARSNGCRQTTARPSANARRIGGRSVVATSRRGANPPPGVVVCSLDELLAASDYVSLHVPLSDETRQMIGRDQFARMKPTAYLINTARGGVVDHAALAAALDKGRIAGAALDVFETEPLRQGHPLMALDNVVLTPHIAAGTRDALATKMRALFANIERFYRGEALANRVF